MLGDQPALEQERAELRAGLDDLDALQQLQRLAGVVGLALQEVVARAAPQVLGLADVERRPLSSRMTYTPGVVGTFSVSEILW